MAVLTWRPPGINYLIITSWVQECVTLPDISYKSDNVATCSQAFCHQGSCKNDPNITQGWKGDTDKIALIFKATHVRFGGSGRPRTRKWKATLLVHSIVWYSSRFWISDHSVVSDLVVSQVNWLRQLIYWLRTSRSGEYSSQACQHTQS